MSMIKNNDQIARMRESCAVAATVLADLKQLVRPGITTQDLDEAGRDMMAKFGAHSADFGYQIGSRRYPAHTCISVNEEIVHGVPSFRRILRDGDIVSLDITVNYKGFIGDNAVTIPVGKIEPELEKLVLVTKESLEIGIRQALVGNRIGAISHAVQKHVESHGYSVVRDLVGHGVGASMHEAPEIPNYGRRKDGPKIQPGMTLAIEPMVNMGTYRTKTLSDGWTVVTADNLPSAHFEHTVLTTENGPEILTVPTPLTS